MKRYWFALCLLVVGMALYAQENTEPPKNDPPQAEPPKVEEPKAEPPQVEPPKVEPVPVEPPKIALALVASPAKGSIALQATVTNVAKEIAEKLAKVTILKDGQPLGEATLQEGQWVYRWESAQGSDGTFQLTAQTTVGETTIVSAPIQIVVDNSPPKLGFLQTAPILLTTQGQVKIQVSDDLTGVARLRFGLGNLEGGSSDNPDKIVEATWNASQQAEGSYTFMVEAVDKVGNVAQATIQVLCDKSAPKVVAGSVTPQTLPIGIVHFQCQIEDACGVNLQKPPQIVMELLGKEYPFTISNFTGQSCDARLVVIETYPAGVGQVYIWGLEDVAGNVLAKTAVGQLTIQEKIVPDGWPLEPRDKGRGLLPAYRANTRREVSGIWIAAKPQEDIKAIEDGKVVECLISDGKTPGYLRIQRLKDQMSWGYHHLALATNPNEKRVWLPGDVVKSGDTLGTVVAVGSLPESYLYLELVTWKNGTWTLAASPLEYLPKADAQTVSPRPLLDSYQYEPGTAHHLQFEVPLHYRPVSAENRQLSDILLGVYAGLLVLALIFVRLWSKR